MHRIQLAAASFLRRKGWIVFYPTTDEYDPRACAPDPFEYVIAVSECFRLEERKSSLEAKSDHN